MDETQLMAFIKWLPTRVKELQNKSPEQITQVLNKLSKTPEGKKQLEGLIQEFKSENSAIQPEESEPGMFRKGGKLNYLIEKFQNGGKKPTVVRERTYVEGRTSRPSGMDRLDFNREYSDGYRASQYSNNKGDLVQLLQRPNVTGGTERHISNNLRDTTYVLTGNSATYRNRPLPWYTSKANEENRKKQYD